MTSIQRIRVPAGFLFAVAYVYFARPTWGWWTVGALLAGAGLLLRLWASGHLVKWERLAVSGPYRHTRNPLYLGSFLMGLGFTVASAQPWLVGVFVILFFLIYIPVMRREEDELEQAYPHKFQAYRREVPFFLPRPGAEYGRAHGASGNFRWQRVISNREYQAATGYLLVLSVLVAKMLWT